MIPGFVDLQVNGAAGVDFGSGDLAESDVDKVASLLYRRGVIGFCPTVTTTSFERYERCLPVLARWQGGGETARNLGVHIEGPFINPDDGPRGIHNRAFVRPASIEVYERLRELCADRVAILTLAPEVPGALELIEHVTQSSKTVLSIGHTDAGAQAIQKAIDAGARSATHLGNGISSTIDRHQNPLWPMLAAERLTALCVTDGFHQPEEMLRVLLKVKAPDRFIVTSDMMPLAGLPPGDYEVHGRAVVLERDGWLHCRDSTQLAGSGRDMLDCMNYLAGLGVLTEAELETVGFVNPVALLGIDPPSNLFNNSVGPRFVDGQFQAEEGW
jgi:N-acetylglucosamine-6-phosphate deacetylase